MPNALVFAEMEGHGQCLIINLSAAGVFTLTKGDRPIGSDVVPVTADVPSTTADAAYVIRRTFGNAHSGTTKKRRAADMSIVPVVGRVAGPGYSIHIDAVSGAITCGARSTTVAALIV